MDYDYIVIGAGINGSWTGYHLAKLGHKTLVIEQFPLPHSRGSSHGQSRGIRKAYPQQHQTLTMNDAYQQWHQLEKDTCTKLIKTTGLLTLGSSSSKLLQGIIDSFQQTPGSEFEEISPNKLMSRYPCLNMGPDIAGCYDPSAGIIMADKALRATWDAMKAAGCQLLDNHPVVEIVPDTDKVRVTCKNLEVDEIRFTAKGLVICAGPWTNKLTEPLGWQLPLRPIKLPVFYFRARDFIPHTFIIDAEENFWGLPEHEYPGLVKICRHDGEEVDADARDTVDTKKDKSILKKFISTYFPGVEPDPSIEESCIYTVSPDEIQTLDFHPRYQNIVIGCGFSGTGFKMAPVTGEILANLVSGGCQKYDLSPFKAGRFGENNHP